MRQPSDPKTGKEARRQAFGGVQLQDQRSGSFYRILGIAVAVCAVGLGIFLAPAVPSLWRQLQGRDPIYEPEHEPNLSEVDLPEVHHNLLPRYIQLRENQLNLADISDLDIARDVVRDAIEPDANLTALFDELDGVLQPEGLPAERGQDKALWLTRAWNQYLDHNEAPYFVRAGISGDDRMYVFTYEVIGDGMLKVDGSEIRIRALSRLDRINQWESHHQSDPREGAIILADRIALLATRTVWPLFGSPEGLSRRHKAFREAVVAEAERDLGEAIVGELRATGDLRKAALRARKDMRERHMGCGLRNVPNQPWNGYDPEQLARLQGLSKFGRGTKCSFARPEELRALEAAYADFAKRPNLEAAVQALTVWLARSAALTEARRYADQVNIFKDEPKAKCPFCSGGDDNALRAEVSAVLGQWAWTKTPATTLFAACHDDVGGAPPGPLNLVFPKAVETLLEKLEYGCSKGPHPDLNAAARQVEETAFERNESIEIVSFLERMPLVISRDRVWDETHPQE